MHHATYSLEKSPSNAFQIQRRAPCDSYVFPLLGLSDNPNSPPQFSGGVVYRQFWSDRRFKPHFRIISERIALRLFLAIFHDNFGLFGSRFPTSCSSLAAWSSCYKTQLRYCLG